MSEQMHPGPKLDVVVAVAVFGYRIIENHSYNDRSYGTRPYCQPPNEGVRVTPKFSTDIAAAWQVVERMGELGWRIQVQRDGAGYCVGMWHLELGEFRGEQADTAPYAICLAALAAMDATNS